MPRCVRCGWPEQAHANREHADLANIRPVCHRFEPPAPWWMRALAWRPRHNA